MTESNNEILQRLAIESYEVSTSKDWHVGDELDSSGMPTVRQLLAWVALCQSEVTEAEDELAHYYLDGTKPCGKVTELADVAIRLWDMAGRCSFTQFDYELSGRIEPIRKSLDRITERARIDGVGRRVSALIQNAVDSTFHEASAIGYGFDMFVWVIEQKMAYNRTRSHRHNGKLA